MQRFLPIAVGVLVIVGLTIVQIRMTDRLAGGNVSAQERAELLKNIPKNIGDWHGTDMPIDDSVRKVAGAEGAVSRQYHNVRTNDIVDLWLIVGHGRAVAAHTPDICYPSSGFSSRVRENSVHTMEMDDGTAVPFLTNTFIREDVAGRRLIRVFWNWYNTESSADKVVWEAPKNARWHFGNTRALYKMYFTAQMRDQMENAEDSPAQDFAKEFIPVVNKALSQMYDENTPAADSANAATEDIEVASEVESVSPDDDVKSDSESESASVAENDPADESAAEADAN